MILKVAAVLGLVFSVGAFSANIMGKVNFKGTAPKMDALKMNSDPYCAKENAGKTVLKEEVVVNSNGTLENVFVYVKEGVKNPPPVTAEAITIDQHGCKYKPHVMGVRVNQPFKILNSDPTMHNIHGLPKLNNQFNHGMPTKGQVIEKKFTKAENGIKIKCDVHGWMLSYLNVVDHPFFAVTDDKGSFTIKDLPPGDYTLEAWHEKFGTQTAKIKVPDSMKPVEFTFGGQG